uniref:Putative neuropeptide n=1 Tax=Helix lucorum TaxID=31229 RepID=Q25079_HELLU|nr:putative neuropeptide precursor [Helix lucorum]
MEQVQLCLCVVLLPDPAGDPCTHDVIDAELDYDTNELVPTTEDLFDLKDKTNMFDPTSVLLTRFRRNTAQWLQGRQHFNNYDHESNRRFSHPRYNIRNNGRGVIAEA